MSTSRWPVALWFLVAASAHLPAGCALSSTPSPASSPSSPPGSAAAATWTTAQRVFDARCVVCHGCFDAPCQLKLDSFDGIARGANPTPVYATRVLAMEPTRLFVDAQGVPAWRARGFHPVVPERGVSTPDASVMMRLLALKRAHPLTPDVDVDAAFTLELGRKEVCPTSNTVAQYEREHPLWGMPYGLPALDDAEHSALVEWLSAGMPHVDDSVSEAAERQVAEWESFFNNRTTRGRLVARYLFEHLYFASLYFEDAAADPTFFVLVRSSTPPGKPVKEIATRRPFDDPGVTRVFYRLVHRAHAPLDKTHMPYALGPARRAFFEGLFFTDDVVVDALPGYDAHLAANPFRVFAALPVKARYRFLLNDAAFTLMGFVKGPVCRGNVALNVINDRFWVAFIDPDSPWMAAQAEVLHDHAALLDLPAEGGSNAPWLQWLQYADHQRRYLALKAASATRGVADDHAIWDGDGSNDNAALTVFRHADHGSVVKGFVGAAPDTAFVIDYAVLERISYLLVSGFDVFGNMSHQTQTRMYMDFLRLEAEANFLAFQAPARRRPLIRRWYRDLSDGKRDVVDAFFAAAERAGAVADGVAADVDEAGACDAPCTADFRALRARTAAVAAGRFQPEGAAVDVRAALARMSATRGAAHLPELSFVEVVGAKTSKSTWLTLIRNAAHSNVASLFGEEQRLLPDEDTLTAVPGLVGAYPSAFFVVPHDELGAFAAALEAVHDDAGAAALRARFGLRRQSPGFWAFSDGLHDAAHALDPIGAGRFDYGRLEGH